jgi:hypothetical protein
VLTVQYRIYSMFALPPRLAHLPNNPGTRAIVLDPDMVIWSGGGKRVTALPHGHLLQDADRIIGGVYISWFIPEYSVQNSGWMDTVLRGGGTNGRSCDDRP